MTSLAPTICARYRPGWTPPISGSVEHADPPLSHNPARLDVLITNAAAFRRLVRGGLGLRLAETTQTKRRGPSDLEEEPFGVHR